MQRIGKYGKRGRVKKTNNYLVKCVRVAFIVLAIAWILNVLHIFIVDQTIMNNTLMGVAIFVALGHAVKYILDFEKVSANYIMLFLLVTMTSFANLELAYQAEASQLWRIMYSCWPNSPKQHVIPFRN